MKYLIRSSIIFLASIFIVPCLSQSGIDKGIRGFWKMQGYGKIMNITDSIIYNYDYTDISCTLNSRLKTCYIDQLGRFELLSQDTLMQTLGITEYRLNRIGALPKEHGVSDTAILNDPIYNFDVFWQILYENYPFFKARNIDWIDIKKQYRKRITHNTTNEELFFIIKEIIDRIGDGHTNVSASDELNNKYEAGRNAFVDDTSKRSEIDMNGIQDAVVSHYVDKPKTFGKGINGKGLVNWGMIRNNTGYIQINNMMFFGDYNIPDSLQGYDFLFAYLKRSGSNPNYQQDEVKGIKKIMDSIVVEFKNADAIIIDIRFNNGGEDVVSLEILRHFIQHKTFICSKKAKFNSGFTSPQKFSITPSDKVFLKPVYLLTSYQSSSAADEFAMSSLALNNFTRIGSSTMGIISDVLMKKLPNGWDMYLSNEVYETYDGRALEVIGVKPDVELDYPKEEDKFVNYLYDKLNKGDQAIETALKMIEKNSIKKH